MAKSVGRALIWVVCGMVLMGILVWFSMPSLMLIEHKSSLSYEETVEALNDVIAKKQNWKAPKIFDFQKNIQDAGHGPIEKVGTVALCNPLYASRILQAEQNRKVTAFMPLGVGVYEDKQGQVYVSELNVGLLGMMFGGTIAEVMADAGKDVKDIIATVTKK